MQFYFRSALYNMDLKQALKSKLTKKELELLKTSFDIVGSVAILDIPEGLEKKEKTIAQELLNLHKNITTVCKKVGERKGVYRLRKYKKILGNGFETIHIESGCRFKIDIREAYFSVRESTERLKIVEQTKQNEKVLVLFSGIGPFGIVLAKKTGCSVDMVEINPKACEYAEENIVLNKVQDRVKNYCGDARKILPALGMEKIGIKSGWRLEAVKNRLCVNSSIIEFHLNYGDLENNPEEIRKSIKFLQKKGIKVMVHQPVCYKGKEIILGSQKDFQTVDAVTKALFELIDGFDNCLGIIMQPTMTTKAAEYTSTKEFKANLKKLIEKHPAFLDKVFLENVFPKVYSKASEIEEIVNEFELKQIAIDTAHFTNANQNNKQLKELLEKLDKKVKIYFHIADSIGKVVNENDCVNLGKGKVDFNLIKDFINLGIIETFSKDEIIGKEIVEDYIWFSKLKQKKYDKILMPLPETAYKFLDLAVQHLGKNGTIYLYAIEGREKGDIESEIRKNKLKILNKRNVLPYAPGVWKVCFELKAF